MATLDEMLKAGYTPQQSPAMQISNMIQGTQDYTQKQAANQNQQQQDQLGLYHALREQGYSSKDAFDRVTRTYQSSNFIQKILTGNSPSFQTPDESDQVEMERSRARTESAKSAAESTKNLAEATKFTSQAGYYDKGGAAQRYTQNDNLTPNQIQQRIKYLSGSLGMGDQEADAQTQQEISYLNDLFNKKSGYKQPGARPQSPPGSDESAVMTGPDGKQYKIPKANVAKAKLRGFK